MPKTVNHDEYRKTLLEKCYELFSRKGYNGVSMREIASESGVSTGTLYHYFPDKADILEKLFSWAAERNISEYKNISKENPPFDEKLNNITNFLVASEDDYLSHLSLSLDLLRVKPDASKDILHDYSETFKVAIMTIIGVDRKLAEIIFIYLLGCATHARLSPRKFSYKESVEWLKQAFQSSQTNREKMQLCFSQSSHSTVKKEKEPIGQRSKKERP
jgi:AcrR family transcriptional regulator